MSTPTDTATFLDAKGETGADETFDASGLLCPLPVYKAAMILNRLAPGQTLELITTDPGSLEDIPAMANQRGDILVASVDAKDSQRFLIRKGQ